MIWQDCSAILNVKDLDAGRLAHPAPLVNDLLRHLFGGQAA